MADREAVAAKRKASPDHDYDYERNERPHESSKRARRDVSADPRDQKARSPPAHRRDSSSKISYDEPERKMSASAEDKKRGKRLFGGLLTTLNQTNTNPLQKRRQEIEKRQMERQERQKEEDTQKRDENLARLQEIREREQIAFEDKVVRTNDQILLNGSNAKTGNADATQALEDDVGSAAPRNKSNASNSTYSCLDIALFS